VIADPLGGAGRRAPSRGGRLRARALRPAGRRDALAAPLRHPLRDVVAGVPEADRKPAPRSRSWTTSAMSFPSARVLRRQVCQLTGSGRARWSVCARAAAVCGGSDGRRGRESERRSAPAPAADKPRSRSRPPALLTMPGTSAVPAATRACTRAVSGAGSPPSDPKHPAALRSSAVPDAVLTALAT